MDALQLNSNVLGYNNDSGFNYKYRNGTQQYKGNNIFIPAGDNPIPQYENKEMINRALDYQRDEEWKGNNEDGEARLPYKDEDPDGYGGLDLKKDVQEQDTQTKYRRLKVSKKALILASQAQKGLPIDPLVKKARELKKINQFKTFINNVMKTDEPKNKLPKLDDSRNKPDYMKYPYFKGPIDIDENELNTLI